MFSSLDCVPSFALLDRAIKSALQLESAAVIAVLETLSNDQKSDLKQRFGSTISFDYIETNPAHITILELSEKSLDQEAQTLLARDACLTYQGAQIQVVKAALEALKAAENLAQAWSQEDDLLLRKALPRKSIPPRLKNDCFAMPQGVSWVTVADALARLKDGLHPVTGIETLPTGDAQGRVLAENVTAKRSNPPMPNSAVDGYGFSHASTGIGVQQLPLIAGRAAAGQPFDGTVPTGMTVRILTGAILPPGVDTVIMEEDTVLDNAAVVFDGPVKHGTNCRAAGEDVVQGKIALRAGHKLRAPDIALLAALGIGTVVVQRALRVGVLSTGDEIIPSPSQTALPHQIWDANRPMLLALARDWGYEPVDLGQVNDDPELIRQRLDEASKNTDVILTSGGASAGDEDHVSALLRDHAHLTAWRIALKPGRPLALAVWQGVPVFGLPGNPVAALICALIFARPALSVLSGSDWDAPMGFMVPAAFSKVKKQGRREYLRARLQEDGSVDVFKSEGSGRISGLAWANGLVELPDEACDIALGTPVRFIPYTSFGIR